MNSNTVRWYFIIYTFYIGTITCMNTNISYTNTYFIKWYNRESRLCTKFCINLLPIKWICLITCIYKFPC